MNSGKKRLFILDANALLHRAWHALPPLTNKKGQMVNAVYGTMMVVMKLLERERPDGFVACWDTKAATFRHQAYAEYKAHREEQPDELYAQIPLIQQGLATLDIDSLELDGYEADDLIGTVATRAHSQGWEVVIVTSDRDALQLVQPGVSVLAFKKGVTETITYDEAEVLRQYGLTPAQFLEYKIIRGDPSDNIPGIKGIGEKGATELLKQFGTLACILAAAHTDTSELTKAMREKLLSAETEIPALRALVTIIKNVPILWEVHARAPGEEESVQGFLREMGFKTLLKRTQGSLHFEESQPRKEEELLQTHTRVTEPISCVVERVEDFSAATRMAERVRHTKEVVIHVARGVPGSLFGEAIESILFGIKTTEGFFLYELPAALIRKEPRIKEICQSLCATAEIALCAHDAKHQIRGLHTLGLEARTWAFDLMLGAYVLSAGDRAYDLSSLALRHAQVVLAEDAAPLKQAEMVLRLVQPIRRALTREGLFEVLTRFELPLIPVLTRMEEAGIQIDRGYLAKLVTEFRDLRAGLEKEMVVLAGRAFNPASPTQLADILFSDLCLPTKGIKKGKTGYSTAASELEKLRGQHPIIEKIEDYREVAKLLSTYVEVLPLLADAGSRVHTTFNQAVAATGRLSSTDPNLQNIPIRTQNGRRIRGAFIAPTGYVLVSCDYSQIELRLAAALSKDPAMTEAFVRGEDIHCATAAKIWGIEPVEVTKDQRRSAKAVNFGILYGQGAHGLAATASIPYADAKKFIEKYFEVYGGFRRYIEETKARARTVGYVETLFGRRRPTPEILSAIPVLRAQAERMAVNMPLQGTAADLMKLAMIEVDHTLGEVCVEAKMLLQVHDELVLEVPEHEARRVAIFVKKTMEGVASIGVPIVVDIKIGKNWAQME